MRCRCSQREPVAPGTVGGKFSSALAKGRRVGVSQPGGRDRRSLLQVCDGSALQTQADGHREVVGELDQSRGVAHVPGAFEGVGHRRVCRSANVGLHLLKHSLACQGVREAVVTQPVGHGLDEALGGGGAQRLVHHLQRPGRGGGRANEHDVERLSDDRTEAHRVTLGRLQVTESLAHERLQRTRDDQPAAR